MPVFMQDKRSSSSLSSGTSSARDPPDRRHSTSSVTSGQVLLLQSTTYEHLKIVGMWAVGLVYKNRTLKITRAVNLVMPSSVLSDLTIYRYNNTVQWIFILMEIQTFIWYNYVNVLYIFMYTGHLLEGSENVQCWAWCFLRYVMMVPIAVAGVLVSNEGHSMGMIFLYIVVSLVGANAVWFACIQLVVRFCALYITAVVFLSLVCGCWHIRNLQGYHCILMLFYTIAVSLRPAYLPVFLVMVSNSQACFSIAVWPLALIYMYSIIWELTVVKAI